MKDQIILICFDLLLSAPIRCYLTADANRYEQMKTDIYQHFRNSS